VSFMGKIVAEEYRSGQRWTKKDPPSKTEDGVPTCFKSIRN
jgi:hypothetical protein